MAVPTSPARLDGLPTLPGVEHRWLDIAGNGGRIRLHLAEAGAGAPVLLLHGWPQHWWCWRRVIEPLGGRYRLLVPDLRGFGWSEAPGGGYSAPAVRPVGPAAGWPEGTVTSSPTRPEPCSADRRRLRGRVVLC